MRREEPWPKREGHGRRPTAGLHGCRRSAICPHDRREQHRPEDRSEREACRAEAGRLVAVFHEVEKHHGQHDHEDDQEYRAEHRMSQTAL